MTLSRSNFYTKVYMWVVNQETIVSSQYNGNTDSVGIALFN